jgi:site-specific DNA-methyltransferase (adenine-specific)
VPEVQREEGGEVTLPKPYYDDPKAGITIYHGDCRVILPELGRFDLLLTDIPYGKVNRASGGLRNLDKGSADTETVTAEWVAEHADCSSAYVFCGTEQVSALRRRFVELGKSTRLCIWEKTNPSPMNGERIWLSSLECCVFARSPGATFREHCSSPAWRLPSVAETPHPTGKPSKLFRRLIEASSNPGDLVVDLTMGAGTTLRAAKDTGRRAIGIELEERWCAYAVSRLRQEVLFGATP